jgi:hypothetical protein
MGLVDQVDLVGLVDLLRLEDRLARVGKDLVAKDQVGKDMV